MIALTSVKVILLLLANLILSAYCLATCSTNCSTVGKHLNIDRLYPVQCLIQSTPCPNLTSPGRYPSAPEIEDYYKVGWYLYQDPVNNKYEKIGLNFSWSPGDDATIQHLEGFKVTVQKESVRILKYFCLGQKLDFFQHHSAKFLYDAIGYCDNTSIDPGQEWTVSILSLPESKNSVQNKIIKIPDCSFKKLENVYECCHKKMFQETFYGNITAESCENKSKTISYNVPSNFGKSALIMLGERILGKPDPRPIHTWRNLATKGRFNVILPSNYDMQGNYSVTIVGDNPASPKLDLLFDFRHCPDDDGLKVPIIVSVICLIVLILLILYFMWKPLRSKNNMHLFQVVTDGYQHMYKVKVEYDNQKKNNEEKIEKDVTVFIIFVDDHPQHKLVVSTFANFLAIDLGFNVNSELYQTKDIYADPVGWMDKSFSEADKVIVIWSPGAVKKWYSYQQSNRYNTSIDASEAVERWHSHDNNNIDLFTPVVIQIFRHLYSGINLKKYFFVHFDYFNKDAIPSDFIDNYPNLHYTLMQQMEDLFFLLKDMEKHVPGVDIKQEKADFVHYSDRKINNIGRDLCEKISHMHATLHKNPLQYASSKNNNTVTENKLRTIDDDTCEIYKNCLIIVPPSD